MTLPPPVRGSPGRPRPMPPVVLRALTASCAAGLGLDALAEAVASGRSGLRPCDLGTPPLPTWIGRIGALDRLALPARWQALDSRAIRLAWLGLQADGFMASVAEACRRHGAQRVGLVLGTSASTIDASERAYRAPAADGGFPPGLRNPALNTPHALAAFVQAVLALGGPCVTVSTACSSSARALVTAERWLRLGWADAVVVGGVDALCDSVLYGFNALQLLSPEPCRPFDAQRHGISIGEAAAFALLERPRPEDAAAPATLALLGHGEANDAHHMSAPHPQGLGAALALEDALARAGLDAADVDHVHLHGTGTAANDAVEAALVARRYRPDVAAVASKGLTGHTMGAAGLLQAVLCALALRRGLLPGSPGTQTVDPALPAPFGDQLRLAPGTGAPPQVAASHAFGFGGNNCVLLFGRLPARAAAAPPAARTTWRLWIDGAALRPDGPPPHGTRPAPALLGPNERRRAPDTVLAALQAAEAACGASQAAADARQLASVFTSAHGDLATVDALCRSLAEAPRLLSPTRFHHSVHNAPSGYWAIATGSHAPGTALAAHEASGAAGWLEAAAIALAEDRPVLLAGADSAACGPLASVHASRGLLGMALVLSPVAGAASRWAVAMSLVASPGAPAPALHDPALRALAANALRDVLPLFQCLRDGRPATLDWPLHDRLTLRLALEPLPAP